MVNVIRMFSNRINEYLKFFNKKFFFFPQINFGKFSFSKNRIPNETQYQNMKFNDLFRYKR